MKIEELTKEYIASEKRSLYSVLSLYHWFNRYAIPFWGDRDIEDISPEIADEFKNYMYQTRNQKTGKPLALATIKSSYQLMVCLFNYAQRKGYILINWFSINKIKIKEYQRPIKYLNKQEVQKLLNAHYLNHEFKFCVFVALFTGMRRGEICALRWKDIDFTHNLIWVNRTMTVFNRQEFFKMPKNNKIRKIPLSKSLKTFFIEYKNKYKTYSDNDRILTIHPDSVGGWFRRFTKELGLDISFKGLRNTFASILLQNGTDLKNVTELMGHSTILITEKSYIGSSFVIQKKAIEDMYNNLEE